MDCILEPIIQNERVHAILSAAFEFKKNKNNHFSLENLTRKTKIPNKSNLHEMLKGRRKIPKKYRASLIEHLEIKGIKKTYLLKKIEHEYSKAEDPELIEEIKLLRKALLVKTIDDNLAVSVDSFKVFCSFGLISEDDLTLTSLKQVLKGWTEEEVNQCIEELIQSKVIEVDKEVITVKNFNVLFNTKNDQSINIGAKLVKHFLHESLNSVEHIFNNEDTLFSSSVISVKREEYLKEVQRFQESLSKFRVGIESSDADDLVSVNVQIYPITLNR